MLLNSQRRMALAVMLLVGCEPPQATTHELSGDVGEALGWTRVVDAPRDELEFAADARWLQLPESLKTLYSLRSPVAIRFAPDPSACLVMVADAADLAVHVFDASTGLHRRSLYLGGRDSSIVLSLDAFDVAPDGRWLIGDSRRGHLVLMTAEGRVLRRWSAVTSTASIGVAAHAAISDAGDIVERPTALPDSTERLPPTRVWNDDGGLLRHLGAVDTIDYIPFSRALSQSLLAVYADTLWSVGVVSARIDGFPISREIDSPVRSIPLEVYHRLKRPRHAVRTTAASGDLAGGMLPVEIGRHVTAFAVDDGGNFLLAMTLEGQGGVLQLRAVEGQQLWNRRTSVRVVAADVKGHYMALGLTQASAERGPLGSVAILAAPRQVRGEEGGSCR